MYLYIRVASPLQVVNKIHSHLYQNLKKAGLRSPQYHSITDYNPLIK